MASLQTLKLEFDFDFESVNCGGNPEFLLDWMHDLGLFVWSKSPSSDDIFHDFILTETTNNPKCAFEFLECCTYCSFRITFEAKDGRTILRFTSGEIVDFMINLEIAEQAFIERYRLKEFQQLLNKMENLRDSSSKYSNIEVYWEKIEAIENKARAFAATVPVFVENGYKYEPEED